MSSTTAMEKHHGTVAEYRSSEGKTVEKLQVISYKSFRNLKLGEKSIKESIVAGGLSEANAKSIIEKVKAHK